MGFTLHSVLMELGAPCVTGYINESVDEVALWRGLYLHEED